MADNPAPSFSSTPGSPARGIVDARPSMRAPELTASKWALRILPALKNGPVRNSELLHRVNSGVPQRMLTQTLRELEVNSFTLRTIYDGVPPRVGYRLSPFGKSLNRTLIGLGDQVRAHWSDMEWIRKS